MVRLDDVLLADPARLAAVERLRRTLPALSVPLAAIASLAARLLNTPMAAVSLVDRDEEFLAARYGLPDGLSNGQRMPLSYSLCRYVVSADDVAGSTDLHSESDPALRNHRLAIEYGIRAFLGAPVRDEHHYPAGSLLLLDTVPRIWTGQDASTLLELARLLRGKGDPGAVRAPGEVTARRRAEQFRNCHLDVEHALTGADSLTDAAPAVLRSVVSALGWNAAELFLIDPGTGDLKAAGHWDAAGRGPGQFLGHTPVRGAGVTGRVWQTGRPVWVPDIAAAPDLTTPFEKSRTDIGVRNGIRTVLAVPVRDDGILLGVLTCYAATTEQDEDLFTVLLDGVAAQIGTFIALRHAKELTRQLERTQDDFISLVGHELRTPLASISAYASLLLDGDLPDDDRRDMLRGITRNSDELVEMVSRLLELAGLEAGHLPLDIRSVDLSAIIMDAAAAVRAEVTERWIHLQVDARTPAVDADAHRLRQAIDGLISNAVKYSPDGGEICVRAGHHRGTTHVQVIDAGAGVPAEERSRVFDRFYRGGNVRHQGTAGNGLGLSLARTIVRLHGGTIGLAGNDPVGTIATITMPTRQPKNESQRLGRS